MAVRLPLALLVAALVLAGCGGGTGPEGVPTAPDAGATVGADAGVAGATQSCENPVEGYAVTFPGDWHTNTTGVLDACSAFDPNPIELPEAGEVPPDIAIVITRQDVAFAEATQDEAAGERLSEEQLEVAGRTAAGVETRATGEGLLDAGTVSYRYYVDLGDSTLVAETHDVEGTDYERNRRILDELIRSLELFGVG